MLLASGNSVPDFLFCCVGMFLLFWWISECS